jgi:hypothetical protein
VTVERGAFHTGQDRVHSHLVLCAVSFNLSLLNVIYELVRNVTVKVGSVCLVQFVWLYPFLPVLLERHEVRIVAELI